MKGDVSDRRSDDSPDSDLFCSLFGGVTGQAEDSQTGDKNGQDGQVEDHPAGFLFFQVELLKILIQKPVEKY